MFEMSRLEVLKILKDKYKDQPLVIPLAASAREMYSLGYKENEFYTFGSMGMPISIATGLAKALQIRGFKDKVVCIEGDGSLLMNMSSLLTIKYLKLTNLIIYILDNESYSVTGNQSTQSSVIDLSLIPKSLGFKTYLIREKIELNEIMSEINSNHESPTFIHIKINKLNHEVPLIMEDPVVLKYKFMKFVSNLIEKTKNEKN